MQYSCPMLSSVACLAVQYFSTLFHKQHVFFKNSIEQKMCVLIFSTSSFWNISHYKDNWAKYDEKLAWSLCKVPTNLVRFQWNLNFFAIFSKKILNFKFHENLSSESRVVLCGPRERHDESNSRLWKFCERFYNCCAFCCFSYMLLFYRNITSTLGENLLYTTYRSPVR